MEQICNKNILKLYNDIKELSRELGFYAHEGYEYSESGKELKEINISSFIIVRNVGINEIVFKAILDNNFDEDRFESRLLKFKNFLLKMKNKEIDIANREQLLSEELFSTRDGKYAGLCDYTFYV